MNMSPIYDFGISAHKWAVSLAAMRNPKAKKMLQGHDDTFQVLEDNIEPGEKYIWIHASSLGEFEQGRPLIEKIKREKPAFKILLTFFSPSGYEVRKNYDKADVVAYLPFDTKSNARRFLHIVNPVMAIFIKYEFWGNYLSELKARNVPTYIVSAIFRDSQQFFRPWGGLFRKMLRCFTTIFVQNEESRALLRSIGVENVEVSGDTRFDRVENVKQGAKEFPVIAGMVKDAPFTLVMGSSWQPDEDIVIPYFNSHPEMKLIIAPHEFDNDRLQALMSRITRPTQLYTMVPENQAHNVDCLIINCFGILSSLYKYGQVAYVGGGFGAGIHNINEAAVYGIPVIIGPNHKKFQEASDLIACGGAFCVRNSDEFAQIIDSLRTDADALARSGKMSLNYIQAHLGATDFIFRNIFPPKTDNRTPTHPD